MTKVSKWRIKHINKLFDFILNEKKIGSFAKGFIYHTTRKILKLIHFNGCALLNIEVKQTTQFAFDERKKLWFRF